MKLTLQDANELMLRGAIALAQLEAAGIRVDMPYLASAIDVASKKISTLETKLTNDKIWRVWKRRYKEKANLRSRPQLCTVLFDDLGIPYDEEKYGRTTGEQRKSTEEVIAGIDHPFARRYTRLQKAHGLKTRLTSLQKEVVGDRLHCDFKLHAARSYRSSSGQDREEKASAKGFNFQAVPHRDEEQAAAIRRAFIPSPGCVMPEVDMSSFEWRIAAAVWKDPAMIAYVKEGRDVHRDLAARMFLCKQDQVSSKMRHFGKNGFVFPVLYGSYYVQVARNVWKVLPDELMADGETSVLGYLRRQGIKELGRCIDKEEPVKGTFEWVVKRVEEWFEESFSTFIAGKDEAIKEYRETGSFQMVTGFVVNGAGYSNNAVLNYRVQGSAFHCLLKGIIEIVRRIRKYRFKTLLTGTIHDSIEGDSPRKETSSFLEMCREVLTEWLPKQWPWIIVPLGIECKIGERNWHDSVVWVPKNGVWQPV